jgi:hypothetical protein
LAVAAEAITAAQFALYEFDVLQQASRARFLYDLVVAKSGGMMKISVFGSQSGFWNLVDTYVKTKPRQEATKTDYHRAIDLWLDDHSSRSCCLVQFESTELERMPRIYLASAQEIAARLHRSTEQVGDPALYEFYDDSTGTRTIDSVPATWIFSEMRVWDLLGTPTEARPLTARQTTTAAVLPPRVSEEPSSGVECLPVMA